MRSSHHLRLHNLTFLFFINVLSIQANLLIQREGKQVSSAVRTLEVSHKDLQLSNEAVNVAVKKNLTVEIHSTNLSTNHSSEHHKSNNTIYAPKGPPNKDDLLNSGALLRGFYVFVGLSIIVMVYFGIKSYCIRKGAPQSTHVSKYGVRARRGDVEMLPLPLDEDTEDDTVFDIGNHPNS